MTSPSLVSTDGNLILQMLLLNVRLDELLFLLQLFGRLRVLESAAFGRIVDRVDGVEAARDVVDQSLQLDLVDRRDREQDDEQGQEQRDHVGVRQKPPHHTCGLELLFRRPFL